MTPDHTRCVRASTFHILPNQLSIFRYTRSCSPAHRPRIQYIHPQTYRLSTNPHASRCSHDCRWRPYRLAFSRRQPRRLAHPLSHGMACRCRFDCHPYRSSIAATKRTENPTGRNRKLQTPRVAVYGERGWESEETTEFDGCE